MVSQRLIVQYPNSAVSLAARAVSLYLIISGQLNGTGSSPVPPTKSMDIFYVNRI